MANWGSFRTSSSGIGSIIIGLVLLYQGHQTEALLALTNGLQGIFARDNAVTSKQAGAE